LLRHGSSVSSRAKTFFFAHPEPVEGSISTFG